MGGAFDAINEVLDEEKKEEEVEEGIHSSENCFPSYPTALRVFITFYDKPWPGLYLLSRTSYWVHSGYFLPKHYSQDSISLN